jgi:hypothetical protein
MCFCKGKGGLERQIKKRKIYSPENLYRRDTGFGVTVFFCLMAILLFHKGLLGDDTQSRYFCLLSPSLVSPVFRGIPGQIFADVI